MAAVDPRALVPAEGPGGFMKDVQVALELEVLKELGYV